MIKGRVRVQSLRLLGLLLPAILCLQSPDTQARDRVMDFESRIVVQPDSAIEVTETFTFATSGGYLKFGIYRDIPTGYRNLRDGWIPIEHQLLEVQRDGQSVSYHSEAKTEIARIHIVDKGSTLPRGSYEFMLRYRVEGAYDLQPQVDLFLWPVTGTGWPFPIERAQVSVTLPPAWEALGADLVTGHIARGLSVRAPIAFGADGAIEAISSERIYPGADFAVAVSLPKGLVSEVGLIPDPAPSPLPALAPSPAPSPPLNTPLPEPVADADSALGDWLPSLLGVVVFIAILSQILFGRRPQRPDFPGE